MEINWIYGTAWKEDRTEGLVLEAVRRGFRGIDTANQAKHYNEPAVGAAIRALSAEGIDRESLWLQTKFTPIDGQDHRLPYDPKASVGDQVRQSFKSSLSNLGVSHVDSYLLHGPYHHPDLGEEDFEVWEAMEELVRHERVRHIGISNVSALQLEQLLARCKTPPTYVQNRCYASRGWDRQTRAVCRSAGATYQGFSLLTANREWLEHPAITDPALRLGISPSQVVFCFAQKVGMVPLTGTTDPKHMEQDLATEPVELTDVEAEHIETMAL